VHAGPAAAFVATLPRGAYGKRMLKSTHPGNAQIEWAGVGVSAHPIPRCCELKSLRRGIKHYNGCTRIESSNRDDKMVMWSLCEHKLVTSNECTTTSLSGFSTHYSRGAVWTGTTSCMQNCTRHVGHVVLSFSPNHFARQERHIDGWQKHSLRSSQT